VRILVLSSVIALTLAACTSEKQVVDAPAAAPPESAMVEAAPAVDAWEVALNGAHRSPENRARDVHRHPRETLEFFGIKGNQTVVEITPGGGWFTEVLAPVLKAQGSLIAAVPDPSTAPSDGAKNYFTRGNEALRAKLSADTATYGGVKVVEFKVREPSFGPSGSADLVVTFRNVHNWTGWGSDAQMFKAFFDVLKPGGVLGVEEHRAKPGTTIEQSKKSGYLATDYVIKLATDAGFKVDGQAEINANPKDTADHPNGVWNLPPSLSVKEGEDKAKYQAIGESDRMTLRFVKPA